MAMIMKTDGVAKRAIKINRWKWTKFWISIPELSSRANPEYNNSITVMCRLDSVELDIELFVKCFENAQASDVVSSIEYWNSGIV